MDLALFKVLGAGLASLAPVDGAAVPAGAIASGARLLDHLLRKADETVRGGVEALMREVWRDMRESALAREVVERHLEHLPDFLDAIRVDPDFVSDALLAGEHDEGGASASAARRIAIDFVGRCRLAELLEAGNLDAEVAATLTETLFARLLDAKSQQQDLPAAIVKFFAPAVVAVAAPGDDLAPAEPATLKIGETVFVIGELAERLSTPEAVLGVVVAAVKQRRVAPDKAMRAVAEATTAYRMLVEDLRSAAAVPDSGALAQSAIEAMTAGRLTEADDLLGQAEDVVLHKAQSDLPEAAEHLSRAAAFRMARAVLAQVRLDYKRAARHCWNAARSLPQRHRVERWRLVRQQAQLLMREADGTRDPAALTEAVEALQGAVTLAANAPEADAVARTNVELGEAQLQQGLALRNGEALAASARSLKAAIELFSELRLMDDWASAQIKLGDALRQGAEIMGDADGVAQAIAAWRAAAGVVSRERAPQLFVDIQRKMGGALLMTAADDPSRYETAITALQMAIAVPEIEPEQRDGIALELAQAQLAQAQARGDDAAETRALDALREALARLEGGTMDAVAWARAQAGYAALLWKRATGKGDLASFSGAAQATMSALDWFEAAGAEGEAEAARQALGQIYADLAKTLAPRDVKSESAEAATAPA